MKQVAFRLDQRMIDKVEQRIERDGITLSAFMRKALRDALAKDPGLPLPVLKSIILRQADGEQIETFRSALESVLDHAFQRFCGAREKPAVKGAPLSQADWQVRFAVDFLAPGVSEPSRRFYGEAAN